MSNKRTKLLTVKEVAEWFGVNPMTIYRKVKRGEIPAVKFGKNWLFPEDILEEWIRSEANSSVKVKGQKNSFLLSEEIKKVSFSSISDIQLIYLFGSAATSTTTPLSDIDIAYLDTGSSSSFDLEAEIERVIFEKLPELPRMDLVRLSEAPIAVQYKAISEGKLVFKSSDCIRSDFEERVINKYLDYADVLDSFYRDSYKI